MRSTIKELKSFEKSVIWADITGELEVWLEEIRDNLENEDIILEQVSALRGSARALRNVISMVPVLVENAEHDQEEDTHGQ